MPPNSKTLVITEGIALNRGQPCAPIEENASRGKRLNLANLKILSLSYGSLLGKFASLA